MLDIVFLVGLLVFVVSSAYFYWTGQNKKGLNSAFLVSFITLISYVLMWQGDLTVVTPAGEPIYWSRWLFYGLSCTLLMVEIAQVKGIQGGGRVQLLYLTAIVMLTGFLAARDLTVVKCAHFAISSVAYILLIVKILSVQTAGSRWAHSYIFFGWTVFPIVFLLAPTGLGLIGAVYVAARAAGKVFGAWFGGRMSGADAEVRRWMGAALMPQAGVAIGMGLLTGSQFPEYRDIVLSVTIGTTVIFELVGPVFTRMAIIRADRLRQR